MNTELMMLAVALGHAVVQSLWQCTLVGAVAATLSLAVRGARLRYGLWSAALGIGVGWFVWTFAMGLNAQTQPSVASQGFVPLVRGLGMGEAGVGPTSKGLGLFEFVALLWGVGFAIVAWRTLGQWRSARRLRVRDVWAPQEAWLRVFERVRGELGVSRRVGMLVSGVAPGPMVVGWISPVVIVPASVLMMLSPEQVRLVLAHELAHIRRFDHLVNMLQVLVETVLFYHPVVWWMSHQMRIEREHCCDDAAVQEPGDAVVFARALAELEMARTRSRATLALHQGGSLMNRVKRIIERNGATGARNSSTRALAVLAAGLMIAGAGYAQAALHEERQDSLPEIEVVDIANASAPHHAPVIEFLQTNLATGALSEERAIALFADAVRPEYDERLAQFEQKTNAAIEAGQLAEHVGQARIAGEQRRIEADIELRFLVEIRGMDPDEAKLTMLARVLDAAVTAGKITREEADAQLERARRVKEHQVDPGEGIYRATAVGQGDGATEPMIEFNVRRVGPGQLELTRVVPDRTEAETQEKVQKAKDEEQQPKLIGLTITRSNGQLVTEEPLIIRPDQLIKTPPAKLTPMDEEYWIHQGVRPLSSYDETFDDGC